jgi:hypothetical protein
MRVHIRTLAAGSLVAKLARVLPILLNLRGFELTPSEFEVFARTDASLWQRDNTRVVNSVH